MLVGQPWTVHVVVALSLLSPFAIGAGWLLVGFVKVMFFVPLAVLGKQAG